MAPPHLANLLHAMRDLCICHSALVMAAWLTRSLVQRNGSWLLPFPIAMARVCSRGSGSTSSSQKGLSAFQDKPRTVEDLPHVSFLELIYRLVLQGFYSRIHELQVHQSAVQFSAWSLNVTALHRVSATVMDPLVCFDAF